jgi:hypothetical protein
MASFSGGTPNASTWRAIAAGAVALVLGLGAGALIEHQRALSDSNTPGPQVTTTTKPKTSVWFGPKTEAACPSVRQWYAAAANAYIALVSSKDWPQTRDALQVPVDAAKKSYQALRPLANPGGRTELSFLLSTLGKSKERIKKSSSANAIFESPVSTRQRNDIRVLFQIALICTRK